MPRASSAARFEQLIDCAADVFIALGYRRAQMDDIAEALGVAKGTLYGYVESKAALFDAALTYADRITPFPSAEELPLPTPLSGATLLKIRDRIGEATRGLELTAALKRKLVKDPSAEFSAIIRDLYVRLMRNRKAIKILDRSALDQPELAQVWFEETRHAQLTALRRYLDQRIAGGMFRALPDKEIFARAILEIVVFWAVHRHWDVARQNVPDTEIPTILADMLLHGLTKERS